MCLLRFPVVKRFPHTLHACLGRCLLRYRLVPARTIPLSALEACGGYESPSWAYVPPASTLVLVPLSKTLLRLAGYLSASSRLSSASLSGS